MKKMTFGTFIRSLRTQNGMTQAQLAGRVGVTDKAVSKWERDISYPDIALFPKLADILGVTVDDLLNGPDSDGQPSRLLQIFEMSHDIRTPLHIILGCAAMARNHRDDEELLLRYLESIRISGEYLLRSIDRVMQVTDQDREGVSADRNKAESTTGNPGPADRKKKEFSSGTHLPASPEKRKLGSGLLASDSPEKESRKSGARPPVDPDTMYRRYTDYANQTLPEQEADREYPANVQELGEYLNARAKARRDTMEEYDFSGRRVLIAEDIMVNREIAAEILKNAGAAVELAEDGLVCLHKVVTAPAGYYDLILMDIMMPNLDGVETARRIRSLEEPEKASIPIIAVSANVYGKDRREALEAGMDAFTEKPIFIDRLFETMERVMQEKGAGTSQT